MKQRRMLTCNMLAGAALLSIQVCHGAQLGPFTSEDGKVSLVLGSHPDQDAAVLLEINRLESLVVDIDASCSPAQLTFHASMPAHDHGMITRSRVQALDSASFRIDGIKLHMGGYWMLSVGVQCGGKQYEFQIPYDL